jgi:predicted  nucleic acid-binding Zn-ribbon protein
MKKSFFPYICSFLMLAGLLWAAGDELAQLKEDLAFEMTLLLDLQQVQHDLEKYDKYISNIKDFRKKLKKAEENLDKYFLLNRGHTTNNEMQLRWEKYLMSKGIAPFSYLFPSLYDLGAYGKNSPEDKSVTHWRKEYWKIMDSLSTEIESINKKLSNDYDVGELRESTFKNIHELEDAVEGRTDKASRKQVKIDIADSKKRIADLKKRINAYERGEAFDMNDLIGVWKVGTESSIEIKRSPNGLSGVLASGSLSRFDTYKVMWSNFRSDPRVKNRYTVTETDRKGNVVVITLQLVNQNTLKYQDRITLTRIR